MAYKSLARWEGGWVNHPADAGKETYAGISRPSHPNWKGWPRVDQLRPQGKDVINKDAQLRSWAREFFKATYWDAYRFGTVADQDLAHIVWDWSIMSTPNRAAAYAWVAMGKAGDSPKLKEVVAELAVARNPGKVFEAFKKLREAHHRRRVAETPSQSVFLDGWLKKNNSFVYNGKESSGTTVGWVAVPLVIFTLSFIAWNSYQRHR